MTIEQMRDQLFQMRAELRGKHEDAAKIFNETYYGDCECDEKVDAALDRLVSLTRALRGIEQAIDEFGVLLAL